MFPSLNSHFFARSLLMTPPSKRVIQVVFLAHTRSDFTYSFLHLPLRPFHACNLPHTQLIFLFLASDPPLYGRFPLLYSPCFLIRFEEFETRLKLSPWLILGFQIGIPPTTSSSGVHVLEAKDHSLWSHPFKNVIAKEPFAKFSWVIYRGYHTRVHLWLGDAATSSYLEVTYTCGRRYLSVCF